MGLLERSFKTESLPKNRKQSVKLMVFTEWKSSNINGPQVRNTWGSRQGPPWISLIRSWQTLEEQRASADSHEHSPAVTETETGLHVPPRQTPWTHFSDITYFTVTQAKGLKPNWFPVTFFSPCQESPALEEIHPLRGQALDLLNLEDCGKA